MAAFGPERTFDHAAANVLKEPKSAIHFAVAVGPTCALFWSFFCSSLLRKLTFRQTGRPPPNEEGGKQSLPMRTTFPPQGALNMGSENQIRIGPAKQKCAMLGTCDALSGSAGEGLTTGGIPPSQKLFVEVLPLVDTASSAHSQSCPRATGTRLTPECTRQIRVERKCLESACEAWLASEQRKDRTSQSSSSSGNSKASGSRST